MGDEEKSVLVCDEDCHRGSVAARRVSPLHAPISCHDRRCEIYPEQIPAVSCCLVIPKTFAERHAQAWNGHRGLWDRVVGAVRSRMMARISRLEAPGLS